MVGQSERLPMMMATEGLMTGSAETETIGAGAGGA
jgi:hypothetical protein